MHLESVKIENKKIGVSSCFKFDQKGTKNPNFMKVELLVAEENVDKQARFMFYDYRYT